MNDAEIGQTVREKYGAIAKEVSTGRQGGCGCGTGGCGAEGDFISSGLYAVDETSALPEGAVLASLGCGNPTALAQLEPGEVVLDLGSGGGIDVLLSARRVGPTGKAIGLDFTDEMLELARENQRKAGLENVEFRKGSIEEIPLPDGSVDVIISNCVINLAADKRRALGEAFRVLKPGGRFAVSDVVARAPVPAAVRQSVELWIGCIAGALSEEEYLTLLADAGFEQAAIEPTRIYQIDDPAAFAQSNRVDEVAVRAASGAFMGAFIRAVKPL
ncbi:MAG: arsenite methyltransferase [Gemmatimonadales bacterium]